MVLTPLGMLTDSRASQFLNMLADRALTPSSNVTLLRAGAENIE